MHRMTGGVRNLWVYFPVLFMLFMNTGCNNDYFNPNKYGTVNYHPDLAVPLASADYSVHDLLLKLDSTTHVNILNNNLVEVIVQDSLNPVYLTKNIVFNDQYYDTTMTLGIPAPVTLPAGDSISSPTTTYNFSFNVSKNERLDSLILKNSLIKISASSDIPGNTELHLKILSLKDPSGNPYSLNIRLLAANGSPAINADSTLLNNYTLDLTDNGQARNTLIVQASVTVVSTGQTISPGDQFRFGIALKNPDYRAVWGYLGNYLIDIPEISKKINLFDYQVGGSLGFENPTLEFKLYNCAGLSGTIGFEKFEFMNVDSVGLPITGDLINNGFTILKPALGEGTYKESGFTITNSNSNIFQVLQTLPIKFAIHPTLTTNPQNDTLQYDFLSDTSNLIPVARLTLPLSLRMTNLSGTQSYALDPLNLSSGNIQNIGIKVRVDNGLPLGGKLKIIFSDSLSSISLDLFKGYLNVILPASTDSNGYPVSSSLDSAQLSITKAEIDTLNMCNTLTYDVILNTSGSASGTWAKITDDQHLKVNVGLYGTFDFNVNLH